MAETHSVAVVLRHDKSLVAQRYPLSESDGILAGGGIELFNREVRQGEYTNLVLEGLGRAIGLDFEKDPPRLTGEAATEESQPQSVSVFEASIDGRQLTSLPHQGNVGLVLVHYDRDSIEQCAKESHSPLTAIALRKYLESIEE